MLAGKGSFLYSKGFYFSYVFGWQRIGNQNIRVLVKDISLHLHQLLTITQYTIYDTIQMFRAIQEFVQSRDCATHSRDCTAHSRDCAAHSRDGTVHSRDCAAHSRDGTVHSRDGTVHSLNSEIACHS